MNEKLNYILKALKFFVILIIVVIAIKKQLDGLGLFETFLFYLLPFLSIYFFLLFLTYLKSNQKKITGLITFFSILFAFITFEIFITYKTLDKETNQRIAAQINNIKYESKNIITYLSDLNKKTEAFPFFRVNPQYFQDKSLMPLGVIPNKITVGSKESGAFYTYKTDRYGFNNPDNVWEIEGKSILLIGDSFTLGTLPNKKNFADIIRKKYKKLINLGIGGNGPLRNYATLVEFIKISNPEYIFWLNYDGNDFEDLNEEINSNVLIKYLEEEMFNQNLIYRSNEVEKLLKLYYQENIEKFYEDKSKTTLSKILKMKRIIEIMKLSNTRKLLGITRSNSVENINYEIFYKLISKASKLSKKNKSKFFFINIPSAYSFSSKKNILRSSKRFNRIQNKLVEKKINYLDFEKKLNSENFEDFFMYRKNGGHLSEFGNKVLGELIIDNIIN